MRRQGRVGSRAHQAGLDALLVQCSIAGPVLELRAGPQARGLPVGLPQPGGPPGMQAGLEPRPAAPKRPRCPRRP